MASNTTVGQAICPLIESEIPRRIVSTLSTVSLYYFKPIALSFDIIGHIICFVAFYKQSKLDHLYSFQFYEVVSKCLDTVGAFINLTCFQWFTSVVSAPDAWYKKVYSLAWFSATFGVPLYDITTNIKLFVALGMTVDRLCALGKPVWYRSLDRRKWEDLIIGGAVVTAVLIHLHEFKYNKVETVIASRAFKVVQDTGYTSSMPVQILVFTRLVILLTAMVALMICGGCLIVQYKRSHDKTVAMFMTIGNDQAKEKAMRQSERTLFILTIFKSCQITNEFLIKMLHTGLSTWKSGFRECEMPLFISVRHIEVTLVNSLDFYVMLVVDKKFRDMIRHVLPWKTMEVHPSDSAEGAKRPGNAERNRR